MPLCAYKLVYKSAPKWHIVPTISNGLLFRNCIRSNWRSVPNEHTVSFIWNSRVLMWWVQEAFNKLQIISLRRFDWRLLMITFCHFWMYCLLIVSSHCINWFSTLFPMRESAENSYERKSPPHTIKALLANRQAFISPILCFSSDIFGPKKFVSH